MSDFLWAAGKVVVVIFALALGFSAIGRLWAFATARTGLGRLYRQLEHGKRRLTSEDAIRQLEGQIQRVERVAGYLTDVAYEPALGRGSMWRASLAEDLHAVCEVASLELSRRRHFEFERLLGEINPAKT